MFSKNKILFFLIIMIISGDIFTTKLNVVNYSILNYKAFEQNQSSLKIIKSLINPDLIICLMSCSEIWNCNAVAISLHECQFINILNDSNLIQDNQVKIYFKKDILRFTIMDNKISNFIYKIFVT